MVSESVASSAVHADVAPIPNVCLISDRCRHGFPPDSTKPKASDAISKNLPGPPFLRHYRAYELVAWQPQGTLDDAMLDEIAEWLLVIEKVARPVKRFVDFSRLTTVAVRTRHVFEFARKGREQFVGVALCAQRCFPTTGSASAIACIY